MVDAVFHGVARRYDLMNDLMSGGLHRLWKDDFVTLLNLVDEPLSTLPLSRVRPGPDVLEQLMDSLR